MGFSLQRPPQGPQGTLQGGLTTPGSRRETLFLLTIKLRRLIRASGFLLQAGMAPLQCGNWLSGQPPTPLMDEKQMLNYSFLVLSGSCGVCISQSLVGETETTAVLLAERI